MQIKFAQIWRKGITNNVCPNMVKKVVQIALTQIWCKGYQNIVEGMGTLEHWARNFYQMWFQMAAAVLLEVVQFWNKVQRRKRKKIVE